MFTKFTLSCMAVYLNFMANTCTTPFTWDSKESTLSLSRHPVKITFWLINSLSMVIYLVNIYLSFHAGILKTEKNPAALTFDFCYVITFIFNTFIHVNNMMRVEEIPEFVSQYMKFNKTFAGQSFLFKFWRQIFHFPIFENIKLFKTFIFYSLM